MKSNSSFFGSKAADFFLSLNTPKVPSPFTIMNPYKKDEVKEVVSRFYTKYYNDTSPRVFIFGINPGRYGGGITGIPFTDPFALEEYCGIKNSFPKKRELSSTFIYSLIQIMGGPGAFFSKYYLTALFPLALIQDGKNVNFYDSQKLYKVLLDHIVNSFRCQAEFGALPAAVSLGKKNALYLDEINKMVKLFGKIITFEHPRFIMQYKRKKLSGYLAEYTRLLDSL